MRLAGIERGGFYPYPPHMAEATASWFIPPPNARGRLLDPCAGEGEIASLLGRLLNCETWGCELFPYRAKKTMNLLIDQLGGSLSLAYRFMRMHFIGRRPAITWLRCYLGWQMKSTSVRLSASSSDGLVLRPCDEWL